MARAAITTPCSILAAGRQEFLEKGYKDASLRSIAARAGVTTGAIYGHWADKAALFSALVEQPAARLLGRFQAELESFDARSEAEQIRWMTQYDSAYMDDFVNILYDDPDSYRLLLCCAEGSGYEDYVDRIIALEETYTWRFMDMLRAQGHAVQPLNPELVHILCSASYNGMFEVVRHNMPRDKALVHIHKVVEFFHAGWYRLMGLE